MKNIKIGLIIFTFILSMFLFLLTFYLNYHPVLEKSEIIASVSVGDKVGFDLNKTALTFGIINAGSNLNRNLIITNDYPFSIKVELSVKGNISRFLVFEKEYCIKSKEKKEISISTINPSREDYGNYSGKVIAVMKRDFFC